MRYGEGGNQVRINEQGERSNPLALFILHFGLLKPFEVRYERRDGLYELVYAANY
jgi:hypothetical protein